MSVAFVSIDSSKPPKLSEIRSLRADPLDARTFDYGFNPMEVCLTTMVLGVKGENWADLGLIDRKIPLKLFYGKREGDEIVVTLDDKKSYTKEITLICRQQNSNPANQEEKFEEAVTKALNSAEQPSDNRFTGSVIQAAIKTYKQSFKVK